MSLLQKKLAELVGQEIVVVMADNRSFRGTLVEHDAETVILRSVVEAIPTNAAGWEEPTASTGIIHKVVTWQGMINHQDNRADVVKLKDAMLQVSGIMRIWEWNLANVAKPEHVERNDTPETRPGTRVSRRS